MKKSLYLLVLWAFSSHAQLADIQFSNEIVLRIQDEYQGLIHTDSSGYLLHFYERSGKGLLGHPGRRLILEKYGSDLKLDFSYEYGENNMISVELLSLRNRLVWIVLEKKGSYKYAYSMIPISLDGKEGKKQELFEMEVNKEIDIPYTFLRPSPDSTTVAFIAEFDANKKRRQTKVYAAVINSKAELVWDKFTTFKGNQKQNDIIDYQLNSNNELLVLAKHYKDSKARNETKSKRGVTIAGYVMNLNTLSADKVNPIKQSLDLAGAFIHDAAVKILPSGEIYCYGLTSEKHRGNLNGVFVTQFTKAMELRLNKKKEFMISDLISLDKADADVNFKKENNTGLDDEFVLCDLVRMENGALIITAEENYTRTQSTGMDPVGTYNNSGFRNAHHSLSLISNDIVIVQVSPKGEIEELNLIPKKQSNLVYRGYSYFNPSEERLRESNLFLSHSYMQKEEALIFLYNDHKDNFELRKKTKKATRLNKMQPGLAYMNEDLSYTIEALFPGNSSYLLAPTRSKQINANQYFASLVTPNDGQRILKIGIITF